MINPTAFVTATTEDDHVAIVITGDIDLSNADDVESDIAAAVPNRSTSASIDLSDVSYIDSIGMRVFFNLAARLRTAQIDLTVIAPLRSPARRIIEISGLGSVVAVEPA